MAILDNVTTKSAKQIWASPDGQRTINEVILDFEGKELKAKTFSSDIPVPGWVGDVQTEEKPGKFGIETFVKQAPKENPSFGHQASSGNPVRGNSQSKPAFDSFTMYLSYAKDLMVARIAAGMEARDDYTELLTDVIAGGYQLYDNRPDAPEKPAEGFVPDVAHEVTDEPITLDFVDALFKKPEGETAWNKNS